MIGRFDGEIGHFEEIMIASIWSVAQFMVNHLNRKTRNNNAGFKCTFLIYSIVCRKTLELQSLSLLELLGEQLSTDQLTSLNLTWFRLVSLYSQ